MRRASGITLVEMLTVVVVLVVVVAVAIPLWRTRELRAHRQLAMDALLAIQTAQDRHFGEHARYADIAQLNIKPAAGDFALAISRGGDELSYVATARAGQVAGEVTDSRCFEFSIDQHGRRSARNEAREDSSDDCWNRK